jgi:hypothetical protein
MGGMRALIVSLGILVAAPAAAQDVSQAVLNAQILQMQAEQQLARMREVATTNELMALEARLRTDEAVRRMEAARAPVVLPTLPYPDAGLGLDAGIDPAKLPRLPDAVLADSNRRVQEILKNSR